jgi:hypothetical protein
MNLSPGQAAESLKEIERTQRRSAEAQDYAHSSPQFILWGLIWMAGYAGTSLLPNYGFVHGISWLWLGLIVIGISGSSVLGRRRFRNLTPEGIAKAKAIGLRWGMTMFVFYAFIVAVFSVMRPHNPAVSGAFIPLLIAAIYCVWGIWQGLRFLYAGIAVGALTLIGWFLLPQYFLPWMAAVGGGSLILVGSWLRKV